MNKLKNIYIDALSNHIWNYDSQYDNKFEQGHKQRQHLIRLINEIYELGHNPEKLFYEHCPEHLYAYSADYDIRTSWEEYKLHLDILQEERRAEYNKNVKH